MVCYNCKKRHRACHDTCKQYLEWLHEYYAYKEKVRRIKELEKAPTHRMLKYKKDGGFY